MGGEDKIREGYNVLSKLVMIMALETRMDGNTSFVATPWGGVRRGEGVGYLGRKDNGFFLPKCTCTG